MWKQEMGPLCPAERTGSMLRAGFSNDLLKPRAAGNGEAMLRVGIQHSGPLLGCHTSSFLPSHEGHLEPPLIKASVPPCTPAIPRAPGVRRHPA